MSATQSPTSAQHPARHRLPGRSVAPLLVGLGIWSGVAGVLTLWWGNTPSVIGPAEWLTGAGRITGLLAGYACAILLLLMARVPLLDHRIGTDRLARWHALGGRCTISLVLAHTLLTIWGYSLTSHTDPVHQTATLVLHYPDLLKGTAAFLLLVATAALSARVARSRMSYETWHYLHFATYAAVFLAFGHQLSDGADFAGDLAARGLWYSLYLGVAALVVWYRFAIPVRRGFRHRLRVIAVHREAPDVVSVYLGGKHLEELKAESGQFFRWRFLTRGLWWAANPYSLSAPPHPRRLRITVKSAGGHSSALSRLSPGTRVWAEGPYGSLTAERASGRRILLVAGGVGITPLRALFETVPGRLTLIYRARHTQDLVLRDELERIAADRGAVVHYIVDDGPPASARLLSAAGLSSLVPDLSSHDVYLCGPEGMTTAAVSALKQAGVPTRRIHHESFAF
ncbi:ferric reductase-like transmembrane domain-containing protein [Streptomyces albidoflavus]